MRKLLAIVSISALVAFGTSMGAAQQGDQATVSRSYDLSGFEAVSVVGPHHVVVSVGPSFSVRAEGPQQTLEDTEVEVEDGRLEIHPVEDERWERLRRGGDWDEYWRNHRPATFHVTLPAITAASLVGGGDMRIDRVEGAEFAASVAGSGKVDLAALRVDDARFSIAGSGDLTARGSARRSRISIAGSGNLQAREVTSDEASISIAGSGNAALTVEDDARVSIVGSGDVDIAGPARCSVSRLGGGRVTCNGIEQDSRRS
jgi:hypothetical protein